MRAGAMHCYWWLVASLLFGFPSQAAVVKVTAEYKPAAYEAENGTFVSTTTCVKTSDGMWLSSCSGSVMSLDSLLFSLKTKVKRNVKKDFSNTKDSFVSLGSLGNKTMIVTSDKGKQFSVLFKPDKLGVHFDSVVNTDDGWKIYNTSFTNPKGGCRYVEKQVAGYNNLSSWIVLWGDVGGKSCYTELSVDVASEIKAMFFGFKIRPPSPLEMSNGNYTGSINLSVGPNKDIDLGNGEYEDNQLTIELTLKVRHQLKVNFPNNTGITHISLQPSGGWHDWIYRGRKVAPDYLEAILPARIWSSAPYNIRLKCQYLNSDGSGCQIKNISNTHKVSIDVYATGMRNQTYLIYANKDENYYGHTILTDVDRPFKFKVEKNQIQEMMKYPGSTYKGDVTIVIDAAI